MQCLTDLDSQSLHCSHLSDQIKYNLRQHIICMCQMCTNLHIAKYKPRHFHFHTFKFQLNVRSLTCLLFLSKSLSTGSMTTTRSSSYARSCEFFRKLYDYRKCLWQTVVVFIWTPEMILLMDEQLGLISYLQTGRNLDVTLCSHIISFHIQQFICFFRSLTSLFVGTYLQIRLINPMQKRWRFPMPPK